MNKLCVHKKCGLIANYCKDCKNKDIIKDRQRIKHELKNSLKTHIKICKSNICEHRSASDWRSINQQEASIHTTKWVLRLIDEVLK